MSVNEERGDSVGGGSADSKSTTEPEVEGEVSGSRMSIADIGRNVISAEIKGLESLHREMGEGFERAVRILLECAGKVIVCGIGKSGIIARKIAATLSSTGTPAVHLNTVEAGHGDMGMVTGEDVFLAVSKSGGNDEATRLIPYLKAMDVRMVSITANPDSALARESDVVLRITAGEEACPMGMVPTTTTTASLALGDALAVAVLRMKDFGREDFARLHPSGVLGRKLYLTVGDLMHVGEEMPLVCEATPLREALIEIVEKKLGCTGVTGADGKLKGIITDGDLKRILIKNPQALDTEVSVLMTTSPRTTKPETLAVKALENMEMDSRGRITQLFVLSEEGRPIGLVHIHDIVRAGLK